MDLALDFRERLSAALDARSLVVVCGTGTSLAATRDPRAGWGGFIDFCIDWCGANDVRLDGDDGYARVRGDRAAGDLISAADKLHRALLSAGQMTRFLSESVGGLVVRDPEVPTLVGRLGTPIITTNYDFVLEHVLSRPPVSWMSTSFGQVIRGTSDAIGHLHGIFTEPDSVVFGSGSYGRIAGSERIQALQRALALHSTLLFVGVGEGLADPNVGELIRFIETNFRDTGIIHYWVCSESQASELPRPSVIHPIIFGRDARTDFLPFLRDFVDSLAPNSSRFAEPVSIRRLLGTPLLPALGHLGPTMADLWPRLFMDMRVRPRKGLSQSIRRFSEVVEQDPAIGRLAILGGPGAGKSTALRSVALAGGVPGDVVADFVPSQAIAEAAAFGGDGDRLLLVDGLDELGHESLAHVVDLIARDDRPFLWLSCRTELFRREGVVASLLDHMDQVVEVLPLDSTEAIQFSADFMDAAEADEVARARFEGWCTDRRFAELLTVPLNLTLALVLSCQLAGEDDRRPPATRFDLYDRFYVHWLAHEVQRLGLSPDQEAAVAELHLGVARDLYSNRLAPSGKPVTFEEDLGDRVCLAAEGLIIRDPRKRSVVLRFLHDTYMEFVLAAEVVSYLRGLRTGVVRLDLAYNDDVNSFIREGVGAMSEADRREALKRLQLLYDSSEEEREREHCLYYMGRLDLPECPSFLRTAFDSESSLISKRAAALGAILHGDDEIENRFISMLRSDPALELMNRSVQLVYFGDAPGEIHRFSDDGRTWSRTRAALLERLGAEDGRSGRLRWWDLETVRCFLESRHDHLAGEDLEMLNQLRIRHASLRSHRDASIVHVIDEIVSL